MVAQRQTPGQSPKGTASSDRHRPTEISNGEAPSVGKPASRDNDGLDLARLSPQQIASELARRSQSLRAAADIGAQDDQASAALSEGRAGGKDDSGPFNRLSQALSPSLEERQRLKQQYIEERYRWEEEQDRRAALKLRDGFSEDEFADRAGTAPLDHDPVPDRDPRPGSDRRSDLNAIPAFTAGGRFAADSRLTSHAAELGSPRQQTPPAKQADPISVYHDTAAGFGADRHRLPEALRIDRDTLGHVTRDQGTRDQGLREPRLTALNAEEVRSVLRAPDDVRGLVTTSFERPGRPPRAPSAEGQASDQPASYPPRAGGRGHRHGALFLLVALAIGATLYFHPWTRGEEGASRPDLSLNTAAGKTPVNGPAVINAPANPAATNSAATVSAPAAGKAETMPAKSPQQASTSPATAASPTIAPRPAGPAPAVEMTPLSAQSTAPQPAQPQTQSATAPTGDIQDGNKQAATASSSMAGEGAATVKAQPDGTGTDAAAPQAMPRTVEPKQSYAPAGMVTQHAAKPASGKLQNETSRASRDITPSPAWLHVQPYGGGTADGAATPDAWMKPQPYREPGVLTPPN